MNLEDFQVVELSISQQQEIEGGDWIAYVAGYICGVINNWSDRVDGMGGPARYCPLR
jgi:hypothetical protein